jgi:hypothetical protein
MALYLHCIYPSTILATSRWHSPTRLAGKRLTDFGEKEPLKWYLYPWKAGTTSIFGPIPMAMGSRFTLSRKRESSFTGLTLSAGFCASRCIFYWETSSPLPVLRTRGWHRTLSGPILVQSFTYSPGFFKNYREIRAPVWLFSVPEGVANRYSNFWIRLHLFVRNRRIYRRVFLSGKYIET